MEEVHQEEVEEELFEKQKLNGRWVGKQQHNKGKDHLHRILKNEKMIEKSVNFEDDRKMMKTLNSETDFDVNVKYSLNKKQRWTLAKNPTNLLKDVPESLEAQIVERNIMRSDDSACFAVHSKVHNQNDPDDFDIRSAYTSGAGQHYSNFSAESRELSKKKRGIEKKVKEDDEEERRPTVIYNIYRAHKNKQMIELSNDKKNKTRKSRKTFGHENLELDYEEDYEDEYEYEDEENGQFETPRKVENYSQFTLQDEKRGKQNKWIKIENEDKRQEVDRKIFSNILNISEYLKQHPYSLFDFEINLKNISTKNVNLDFEIENLIEKGISIDRVDENSIVMDIGSKWINKWTKKCGQCELIIAITHINKRLCRVIINSIVEIEQKDQLRSKIDNSRDFYEIVEHLVKLFLSNRIFMENRQLIENGLIIDDLTYSNNSKLSTCQYLLTNGVSIDWSFICETVYPPSTSNLNFASKGVCDTCNLHKSDGLYSNTCSSCLSSQFYHQFSCHQIPIDINYRILQRIIPLPVLNLYTCQLFESVHSSGYEHFENCPRCMTFQIYASNVENNYHHKCTNCENEYCSKCEKEVHWPMTCSEYEEWNEKWTTRLMYENAQGDGTEHLVQLICQCRKSTFCVRMPCDQIVTCPKCKILVSMDKMKVVYKKCYTPWSGRAKKWWGDHPEYKNESKYACHFFPHSMTTIAISEIPELPKSVIDLCKTGRNLRKLENNHGYLIEMINAWMYVRRHQKENKEEFRNIRKTLENLKDVQRDIEMVLQRVNAINS